MARHGGGEGDDWTGEGPTIGEDDRAQLGRGRKLNSRGAHIRGG